jgi:hypothetical protein
LGPVRRDACRQSGWNTDTESLAPTTDTTERRLRRVEKPQNLMKQFKLDPGEKIALVGAEEDFSIVVTTNQRCYTFGSGHVDEPEYLPTDIQLSNAFPGGRITEILGVDGGASHGCITLKVEPTESNWPGMTNWSGTVIIRSNTI